MKLDADFILWVAEPVPAGKRRENQSRIAAELGPIFEETLAKYGIDMSHPLRVAHFMGQTMVEAAHYSTMREFADGHEYEGRRDLGNTQRGDGVRYAGRGLIQLTGRDNYTKMAKKLGVPIVEHPELVEQVPLALIVSLEYWSDERRYLNRYADRDDIDNLTQRINGKWTGLNARIRYTDKAKRKLGLPIVPYRISKAAADWAATHP